MWGEVWVRRRGLSALVYKLPSDLPPVGGRVLVPLGRHNTPYIGLLMRVLDTPPAYPEIKPILQALDAEPLYDAEALRFFRWMAEYYMATPGDLAHVVLPGRIGGIADWIVSWKAGATAASPKKVFQQLRGQDRFSLRKAARLLNIAPKRLLSIVRRWGRQDLVTIEAVVRQTVRRPPSFIEVVPSLRTPEAFQAAWEKLPPELQPLLLELLQRTLRGEPLSYAHLLRREGKKLKALLKKGHLRRVPVRTYYEQLYARPLQPYTLTPAQQAAFTQVQRHWTENPTQPILLHGVTASGKTFVYLELMRRFLQEGKQVLYLLPEIALTKQTLDRLRATFGEAMELYHSGLSEAERIRTWRAVREDAVDVVVGTRSALFLPFHRLGLIIVDEEHDPSFGQEGRAPLYQARDAAVYYAHLRKIPIVLGSATPSLETYRNALQGKYAYVSLPEKALPAQPPQLHLVDMRIEFQEKLSTGVFSSVLYELLQQTLARGEQAILFRNRRGYAPMLLCQTCGHRWECPDCAITLTYHKKNQALVCHYCGKKEKVPARCPVCGGDKLSFSGIGTERIEEQLQQFLPGARVLRLDRDTTGAHSHEAIIAAFERGKADVLVGTQMVTKGLDFERVTLVGVLYADSLLGRADFRAEERAYQLLVQLMGRAGRRGAQSHLVIQTFKPDTSVFHELTLPYAHFAQRLLPLRQRYGYPPFTRLIEINLFHKDPFHIEGQAEAWATSLKKIRIGEVLGPVYADIPRVRGRYHMKLLLKLPSPYPYAQVRKALSQLAQQEEARWGHWAARVVFRIDP